MDQAKSAVLNSLGSADAERGYRRAIDEFIVEVLLETQAVFQQDGGSPRIASI